MLVACLLQAPAERALQLLETVACMLNAHAVLAGSVRVCRAFARTFRDIVRALDSALVCVCSFSRLLHSVFIMSTQAQELFTCIGVFFYLPLPRH